MLYKKTPSDTGWYWLDCDGTYYMAYLAAEEYDEPRLLVVDVDGDCMKWFKEYPDAVGHWSGISEPFDIMIDHWIGPLSCPYGDFADSIVEPELELHQIAEEDKTCITIKHTNFQHADSHGGTWTTINLVKREFVYDDDGPSLDLTTGEPA